MNNQKRHQAVDAMIEKFTAAGVSYCHFKSNEHVLEGICGDTDLDILIDRGQHDQVAGILVESGFKLFRSGPLTQYPAVEDWIGFDAVTGDLAHLHIHWQMIAGEPYLKGYRLPWEQLILDSRVWDEANGIHTSSREMELILLLTRAALKAGSRNRLRSIFGKKALGADIHKEYAWLLERVDRDLLEKLAASFLPDRIVQQILVFKNPSDLESVSFQRFRHEIKNYLANWRTYSPGIADLVRWQREISRRIFPRIYKKTGILSARRRTPVTGGLIVAILGADGSGKSTQTKSITQWLGWKLDVSRIYFGSGDGPTSWHRFLLMMLRGQWFKTAGKNENKSAAQADQVSFGKGSKLKQYYRALFALSLAYEKRSKIKKVVRARNKGMIVICDRYPQNQIMGYNDGPLLEGLSDKEFPWNFFSSQENRLLSVFSEIMPDLVIKLNVSHEMAEQRKPDTPKEMIQKKIDAVQSLSFGSALNTINIDADKPLDEVSLLVRQSIWQQL